MLLITWQDVTSDTAPEHVCPSCVELHAGIGTTSCHHRRRQVAAPSRSDEAGCGYPFARSDDTKVTSQQSAPPRRELEPAPVIWCTAWRGGSRQPLLGDNPSFSVHGLPRNANLCSLGHGGSPGQQPTAGTGGTVVPQMVNQGLSATTGCCQG